MATASTIPAKTRSGWSDTRPNGQPLEKGTVCWITEVEGENPIAFYGRTVEEVLDKLSYTLGHAQAEIARRANAPRPASVPSATPPAARPRMNANDVMQATSDLGNPAKAADAITRLVEDATGVDLKGQAIRDFRQRAQEWQEEHPEFFAHDGNIDLLTTYARRAVNGDWASITKGLLTSTFEALQQRGLLFEAPEAPAPLVPPVTTFPGGSPVQRVEYSRGGRPGTGTRSTNFRATQTTQPRTPKYSDDDIRKMPASKQKELIEKNDPDWKEATDRMYGVAHASA